MSFSFENLDKRTRELMLDELKQDLMNNKLYISSRLNSVGQQKYSFLLEQAINDGDDNSLALSLSTGYMSKTEQRRKPRGGYTEVKVPENAHTMLAEGEFNRYYIRALCRRVIEDGNAMLEIYRAKHSENPRPGSEIKIGEIVDPQSLLDDLKNNIGVDTALGIPAGPNSGLSVRIIESQQTA